MNLDPDASIRRAFPGLPEETVRELASAARVETYHPGFILCHEGRVEDSFYVIVSGHAEVSKQFDDETRRVLHRLGPGDFFGEIALVQKGPRIATVRTLEMTTVLQIDRDSFDAMLERSPRMMLRIVRHVASRLRDADQKAISDLRRKNVELARAYAALEGQQRLRSEFLTTVSHELRTPLAAVTGYLQFLRSGALTSEQRIEMLETVSRNVDRVIHLVNSILFLQELELITPEFHPVDPGNVALEAVQEAREQAAETEVRLQVQIEPDLPVIQGDAMELERAVAVLLDNAIKFSPDGGNVSVEVFAGGNHVGIRVSDPGVGIPTEELENIFEPFTQAPPPEGRLFGGIGVGLPIARHVVELHGGRIEVESAAGQGSTFTIFLPVRRHAPAAT
jgi:signal transduction histidine kinase